MRSRTTLLAMVMMALGGLLGYAAASGQFTRLWQARAAAPPSEPGLAGTPGPACCDAANKGDLLALAAHNAAVQEKAADSGKKPNILVIFGDDIGIPQVSAYTQGLMGYRTPNIDRIAREGALFTD